MSWGMRETLKQVCEEQKQREIEGVEKSRISVGSHPYQLLIGGEHEGWFSNIRAAEKVAVDRRKGVKRRDGDGDASAASAAVCVIDTRWDERWLLVGGKLELMEEVAP